MQQIGKCCGLSLDQIESPTAANASDAFRRERERRVLVARTKNQTVYAISLELPNLLGSKSILHGPMRWNHVLGLFSPYSLVSRCPTRRQQVSQQLALGQRSQTRPQTGLLPQCPQAANRTDQRSQPFHLPADADTATETLAQRRLVVVRGVTALGVHRVVVVVVSRPVLPRGALWGVARSALQLLGGEERWAAQARLVEG